MNQIELEKTIHFIHYNVSDAFTIDRLINAAAQVVRLCARLEEEHPELSVRPALHLRELRRAAERVANITDAMPFPARRQLLEDAMRSHGEQLVLTVREELGGYMLEEEDVS